MAVSILVATPHTAFGELLRISLEDNKPYQAQLVFSGQEVRTYSARSSYQLAILDADLLDEPFIPLCYDLLDQQKGIRLVIIPPENNPNHPALGGLMPHGYLNRPFYLPDLIETVSRLINQSDTEPKKNQLPASYTVPPWLQEPLTLQGYLEKEITQTQALAGFVGMNGPQRGTGELYASAGRLSEAASQELAGIVFRYWNRDEKTDLMRFMRLAADKVDYLVYATQITGDLVLILVYDTGAPLSQIRPQTRSVAQTLAAMPPEGYRHNSPPPKPTRMEPPDLEHPEQGESLAEEKLAAHQPAASEPETQPINEQMLLGADSAEAEKQGPAESDRNVESADKVEGPSPLVGRNNGAKHPASRYYEEDEADEEGQIDEDLINLAALLGNIPAPDPDRDNPNASSAATGWDYNPEISWIRELGESMGKSEDGGKGGSGKEADREEAPVDSSLTADHLFFGESSTANESQNPMEMEAEESEAELADGSLPPEYLAGENSAALQAPKPKDMDRLDDTRPRVISAISNLGQMEPISPAISLLNYTCVLVPRMPQHYLTGELAEQLSSWVQQLCLAFGWRLEGIAVRPDYLQWTVQVAPSISPGNLVRIIRQRTSQQIFARFTNLQEQNPSGDFWAVGYLIVSGSQPPSAQLLRDYIAQTRKRQGITK